MKLCGCLLVILWLSAGIAVDNYLIASNDSPLYDDQQWDHLDTVTEAKKEEPKVSVSRPAAPPSWAQELIVLVEKIPVVGPILAKIILYLGILSSILTTVVGALLGVLNTTMAVLNFFERPDVASLVARIRDGKIMYWLRFFSLFNAKKRVKVETLLPQN